MKKFVMVVALLVNNTCAKSDLAQTWVVDVEKDSEGNPVLHGDDWAKSFGYGYYSYRSKDTTFFHTMEEAQAYIKSLKESERSDYPCEIKEILEVSFKDDFIASVDEAQKAVQALGEFAFAERKALRKKYVDELGFNFKSRAYIRWALSSF